MIMNHDKAVTEALFGRKYCVNWYSYTFIK